MKSIVALLISSFLANNICADTAMELGKKPYIIDNCEKAEWIEPYSKRSSDEIDKVSFLLKSRTNPLNHEIFIDLVNNSTFCKVYYNGRYTKSMMISHYTHLGTTHSNLLVEKSNIKMSDMTWLSRCNFPDNDAIIELKYLYKKGTCKLIPVPHFLKWN